MVSSYECSLTENSLQIKDFFLLWYFICFAYCARLNRERSILKRGAYQRVNIFVQSVNKSEIVKSIFPSCHPVSSFPFYQPEYANLPHSQHSVIIPNIKAQISSQSLKASKRPSKLLLSRGEESRNVKRKTRKQIKAKILFPSLDFRCEDSK